MWARFPFPRSAMGPAQCSRQVIGLGLGNCFLLLRRRGDKRKNRAHDAGATHKKCRLHSRPAKAWWHTPNNWPTSPVRVIGLGLGNLSSCHAQWLHVSMAMCAYVCTCMYVTAIQKRKGNAPYFGPPNAPGQGLGLSNTLQGPGRSAHLSGKRKRAAAKEKGTETEHRPKE